MVEMMRGEQYRFEFIGGEPCLDFTNTVGGERRVDPSEHLHGYADLVAGARQGELLSPAPGRALPLRARQAVRDAGDHRMQLALRGREPQRIAPLVQHEGLRQPRQGATPLSKSEEVGLIRWRCLWRHPLRSGAFGASTRGSSLPPRPPN